jgi:hypothetical protein
MRHQKISCIERALDFASIYNISLPSVVVLTKNKVVASLHLSCMSVTTGGSLEHTPSQNRVLDCTSILQPESNQALLPATKYIKRMKRNSNLIKSCSIDVASALKPQHVKGTRTLLRSGYGRASNCLL